MQKRKVVTLCIPPNCNKATIGGVEKRDNSLFYLIFRHNPILFSVGWIVLKVIVRKYYSKANAILLWLACMNG